MVMLAAGGGGRLDEREERFVHSPRIVFFDSKFDPFWATSSGPGPELGCFGFVLGGLHAPQLAYAIETRRQI